MPQEIQKQLQSLQDISTRPEHEDIVFIKENKSLLEHQPSVFTRFLNIFHHHVQPKLSVEQQALQKQAQSFLDSEMFDLYFKMQKEGYKPSLSQQNQMDKKLLKRIDEGQRSLYNCTSLSGMIDDGIVLSPAIYTILLTSRYFAPDLNGIKCELDNPTKTKPDEIAFYSGYKSLVNHLQELSEKPEYQKALMDKWQEMSQNITQYCKKGMKPISDRDGFHYLIQSCMGDALAPLHVKNLLYKGKNLDEYMQCIKDLKKLTEKPVFKRENVWFNKSYGNRHRSSLNLSWKANLEMHYKEMEANVKSIYANRIENTLTETRDTFQENYVQVQTEKTVKEIINNSDCIQLPGNVQTIIETIQLQYQQIMPHYDEMCEGNKEDIDKLVDKEIPFAVKRYLTMDEEYRQTMVNAQGKNAAELLEQSLTNISEMLGKTILRINEMNLNELSVSARYTKEKNRFH